MLVSTLWRHISKQHYPENTKVQCFGMLSSSNEGDQNVPRREDFLTFSIPSDSHSSFFPEAESRIPVPWQAMETRNFLLPSKE